MTTERQSPFIGRQQELHTLKDMLQKKSASLIVIKGRRRIGKSRLIEEFAKSFPTSYYFTGLAPTLKVSRKQQRQEFMRQMSEQGIPRLHGDEWGDLFRDVANHCKRGRVLIAFDEISWMGSKDSTFLGQLKIAWDQHFTRNSALIMILSGSQSTWIDNNILKNTGFVGRISYRLTLHELPLHDCNLFWQPRKELVSPYEKFKTLAVTGGIPLYLEAIKPLKTAEENIKSLCFDQGGLLFNEFEEIFSDLFSKRNAKYRKIVRYLVDKKATLEEIATHLNREKGGDLSASLEDLCETGFISRDYAWHLKDGSESKLSLYRLSDNYVRFYLKYIEPNRRKIIRSPIPKLPPSWFSILGYQFENMVVNNRLSLHRLLNLSNDEIISEGPYFQTETAQRKSCQIDYLIQTKFNNLYVCEVKFKRDKIDSSIINEVQDKINLLERPRGFSCRPVLIHVNGVADSVIEQDYFSTIIDFGDLLSN